MESLTRPPRKTIDDYLALGEGVRAELVGGEILVPPGPTHDHQHAVGALLVALTTWSRARQAGDVTCAPMDVHLPSGDVVEPDVVFVSTSRLAIVGRWIHGVPDLLVEVLSPSNEQHDRVVKRGVYATNGVPEYWIVDLVARTVEVLVLEAGVYRATRFGEAEAVVSARFPGFALPVEDLLFRFP